MTLAVVLCLLVLVGCGSSKQEVDLETLRELSWENDILTVTLGTNQTTGCEWSIHIEDDKIIDYTTGGALHLDVNIKTSYLEGSLEKCFAGKNGGSTDIVCTTPVSWDGTGPGYTYVVTVMVNDDGTIAYATGAEGTASAEADAMSQGQEQAGTDPASQGEKADLSEGASGRIQEQKPEDYAGDYHYFCMYADLAAVDPEHFGNRAPQYISSEDGDTDEQLIRLTPDGVCDFIGGNTEGLTGLSWSVADGNLTISGGETTLTGTIQNGIMTLDLSGEGSSGMAMILVKEGADTSGIQPIPYEEFILGGKQDTSSRVYQLFQSLDIEKGIHINYTSYMISTSLRYDAHGKGTTYYSSFSNESSGSIGGISYTRDGYSYTLTPANHHGSRIATTSKNNPMLMCVPYNFLYVNQGRGDYTVEQMEVEGVTYTAEIYPANYLTSIQDLAFCFDGNGNLSWIVSLEAKDHEEMRYKLNAIDSRVDEALLNLDLSEYTIEDVNLGTDDSGASSAEAEFSIRDFGYTANGQKVDWQDNISGFNQDLSDVPDETHWLLYFYDPEYDESEIDTWEDEKGLHIGSTASEVRAAYGEGEQTKIPKDSEKYYASYGLKADSYLIYTAREGNVYRLIFVLDSSDKVIAVRYEACKE